MNQTTSVPGISGLRLWTINRKHYPMDDVWFY